MTCLHACGHAVVLYAVTVSVSRGCVLPHALISRCTGTWCALALTCFAAVLAIGMVFLTTCAWLFLFHASNGRECKIINFVSDMM